MNPHEEALVTTFMESSRQERFRTFLRDPKKRKKFTRALAHRRSRLFKANVLRMIPPRQQNPDGIYSILKSLGAQEKCWVISEGSLDGHEFEPRQALEEVVGRGFGTLLSCIPGRLAFLRAKMRYILQSSANAVVLAGGKPRP